MTLECEEPYELKGDQFVTCVEGTTFTSTTVPYCEGKNTVINTLVITWGFTNNNCEHERINFTKIK